MDDTVLESGVLIRVQPVMRQLMVCHLTDGMDKVSAIKIVEPVFIGIVHVGLVVEIMSRRVLHTVLIMSILGRLSTHV